VLGCRPREVVIAFWILIAIVILAILGFTARAALVVSVVVVLTMLASRACAHPKLTYFGGLQVVASINPTGEFIVSQIFVWPALVVATAFSWFLGLIWLLGGREWPRARWLGFLRRYQSLAKRVTYRH
jgi:hypothetical protein